MLKINIYRLKKIRLTPVQLIVASYFVATIIAMGLLSLPLSLQKGVELSYVDSLFTSVSAISVTGLTVVNTAETFSVFGVFMLMLVLQFGGIGLMTLGTFVYILLGRNIGLAHRKLIMIDQNRYSLKGLVQTIRLVLGFAITLEAMGGFIFGTYFIYKGYVTTWYEGFYYGFFMPCLPTRMQVLIYLEIHSSIFRMIILSKPLPLFYWCLELSDFQY